jgi:hypothetical protein
MNLQQRLQTGLAALLLGVSLLASAQVEDTDAVRLAARFAHLAGSDENAMALVLALHSGSTVQLAAFEGEAGALPEMIALEVPTPAMSWADVRTTLLNVQDQLVRAGILRPTIEQLQAALMGGEIASPDGRPVPLRGVLQLRAEGLTWLDIARASAALPAPRRVSAPR